MVRHWQIRETWEIFRATAFLSFVFVRKDFYDGCVLLWSEIEDDNGLKELTFYSSFFVWPVFYYKICRTVATNLVHQHLISNASRKGQVFIYWVNLADEEAKMLAISKPISIQIILHPDIG